VLRQAGARLGFPDPRDLVDYCDYHIADTLHCRHCWADSDLRIYNQGECKVFPSP
jgi:hypothetical protein